MNARLVHIGPLANNLREADRRECEALGRTPKAALRMSLNTSFHAVTALSPDGMPLAMFGVAPRGLLSGRGTPWFLGRDEVFEYARDLMMRGPKIIAWFQETFPDLSNIVSVENMKAIAMLRRWGAEIGDELQIHRGLEFVPFAFRAADSVRRIVT